MAHGPDITPGAGREIVPGSRRGGDGCFALARAPHGQWLLLDPAGLPFFAKSANDVRNENSDTDVPLAAHPAVRLREWGFNAVGPGGDGCGRDDGMPYFGAVQLCRALPVIVAPGIRVPDVFAPDWTRLAAAHAQAECGPHARSATLIAWVPDEGLSWGDAAAGRPGLLQVCLSLEPTFAAYHAAWEFVLASHGGRLESVAAAWGIALPNKEALRERTKSETAIVTRGYGRDEQRWTREFARRYFRGAVDAIRAADPNHLVSSCRFASHAAPWLIAAASGAVDLVLLPWLDLPGPGAVYGPIIASDVSPIDLLVGSIPAPRSARAARLTTIEKLLRRTRTALRRLARHPGVVGYTWRQWLDTPGEIPPFSSGLVHAGGREARTNVELAVEFNARADALRRAAAKQLTL